MEFVLRRFHRICQIRLFYQSHLMKNIPHGLTVKVTQDIKMNDVLSVAHDIFKFKDKRATSVVVENRIRNLIFYYNNLPKDDKEQFLLELVTKHCINHAAVQNAAKQVIDAQPDSGIILKSEEKLRDLLTPQYTYLFTHLGNVKGGVKLLVDIRSDILNFLQNVDVKSPHLQPLQQLNATLKDLLSFWFSVGLLNVEKVSWSSSCSLLQKIAEYEKVHPVHSWDDIRQRVGLYRRCFVYTHHSMPGEPLVVLHVALTDTISDSVASVIHDAPKSDSKPGLQVYSQEDPQRVKAFIFYSISSTQKGLQGIDLGNYLIKRAAKELLTEFPRVNLLFTLSPIPTFRLWLVDKVKAAERGEDVFPKNEWTEILEFISSSTVPVPPAEVKLDSAVVDKLDNSAANKSDSPPADKVDNPTLPWAHLRAMLEDNSWFHDEKLLKMLQKPLLGACCRYLYFEKHKGYAFDRVANFHLRNGATIWRVNWLADTSSRGLTNSCGMMVNYRYEMSSVDANSVQYVYERYINVSKEIAHIVAKHRM